MKRGKSEAQQRQERRIRDARQVMSTKRREDIECHGSELTPVERAAGFHQCPDWDFLVVGPNDPEAQGCLCGNTPSQE